jgi:uncharacterized protein (TIGR02246 family)
MKPTQHFVVSFRFDVHANSQSAGGLSLSR